MGEEERGRKEGKTEDEREEEWVGWGRREERRKEGKEGELMRREEIGRKEGRGVKEGRRVDERGR